MRDTETSYGAVTRFLHWFLFILIVVQFLLVFSFGLFPESSASFQTAVMLHESFGLLILFFGLVFIVWRWNNPKPFLKKTSAWQRTLARATHIIIYIAIIAQPIFGIFWVMSQGHPVAFFSLLYVPQLVPASKGAGSIFGLLHEVTGWWILLIAVGIHVLAALYHHFVVKDKILSRMWRGK